MIRVRIAIILLFILSVGVFALIQQTSAAPERPKPEEPFNERLLEIAKNYGSYGRIDDDMRWAPTACRPPTDLKPGVARFSASKDENTHGRKLYSLFAKSGRTYRTLEKDKPVEVGQVVVKESWVPEEVTDAKQTQAIIVRKQDGKSKDGRASELTDHFLPYAEKDGKTYHAAKQSELFIMFKMDPKTADTDEGWVYGTVTPDGKRVTSAGKVDSCMKCHQKAAHDRLFGMPEKP
jgi:hypothetical protein